MGTLGRTRSLLFASALSSSACGLLLSACGLLLSACGDRGSDDASPQDGGSDAATASADAEVDVGDAGASQHGSVDFETDDTAAGTGMITFSAGGSIEATGTDGTVYRLDVPPYAVASDVTVTLTPLLNLLGVSAEGPVYGVTLAPDGLLLQQLARLSISPAQAIPASASLSFGATASGEYPGESPLDVTAATSVILVERFRLEGIAAVTDSERAALQALPIDDARTLFSFRVGALLNDAHRAHLLGENAPASDLSDAFSAFEGDVLTPQYADADTSCDASNMFLDTALSYARMRGLTGDAQSKLALSDVLDVVLAHEAECQAEAMSVCRAGRDPAYLLEFRMRNARARKLLADAGMVDASSVPSDLSTLLDSATSDCAVQGFHASGGSDGLTLTGELDDPSYPFTLSGDLDGVAIVVSFTPGQGNANTGSYQYSAKSGESGHGTYTLSAGPGKGMTLVADGERCAADSCSASEDTIVLSPRS